MILYKRIVSTIWNDSWPSMTDNQGDTDPKVGSIIATFEVAIFDVKFPTYASMLD